MIAIVFPGQGSQKPGMGRDLAEQDRAAAHVFDAVSEAVGQDVRRLCWESDDETLRQTDNSQIALFTAGVAAWKALEFGLGETARPIAFAGHSVGEYAALAAAGVIDIAEGARLVKRRGELMAAAGREAPGTMAAVLGLGREELTAACAEVTGVVVVANDNCPGQLVISGEVDAVRQAGELASQRGAKRVIPLNVSGAFHSPLMAAPAREMATALATAHPQAGRAVYSNVTSEPVADAAEWPGLLEQQLVNPVRWTETTEHLIRDGAVTFVECGGGDVLSGLIRRTDKGVTCLRVADIESLSATLVALG